MNPTILIVMVAALAAFFILKRVSFVSAEAAQKLLRQGAIVIDVRSRQEFQEGCLPGAINIPLGELRDGLPRRVKAKSQPLLLHCLSGGRSGMARSQLKRMGYVNVFNLGSLARARRIVEGNQSIGG